MTPLPKMLSFSFRGIFFSKWFPKWISGNISINIYEPVSFTKFDERDQIINFSDETSSFKSNKVKLKLQRTQYLENFMSYMSAFEVVNIILKISKCYWKNVPLLRMEGRVMILIKKNLSYKIRKELSRSNEHKEIFSIAI